MPSAGKKSKVISLGGAGGLLIPASATIPFSDTAARDAWAESNLTDLVKDTTAVNVTAVSWFVWRGETSPSSYQNSLWVNGDELVKGEKGDEGDEGDKGDKGEVGNPGVIQSLTAGNSNVVIDSADPANPVISGFLVTSEGTIIGLNIGLGITSDYNAATKELTISSPISANPIIGRVPVANVDNTYAWVKSGSVFSQTQAADLAAVTATPYDIININPSRYSEDVTKAAGLGLFFKANLIESEVDATFVDFSLDDDGDDVDGDMVLSVTMTTTDGTNVKKTISLRSNVNPTPPLDTTTVIFGWTNNTVITVADVEFALNQNQTATWGTRTEGVTSGELSTAEFRAIREGSEYKYFFIAHKGGYFIPPPYAIDWGLGTTTQIIINNLSYQGETCRSYMIANSSGEVVANSATDTTVKLIQGS